MGTICNESNSEGESVTTTVYDRHDVGGQLQDDRAGSTFYMHNLRPKDTDSSVHALTISLVAYDPEAPVFEPDDPHANMIPLVHFIEASWLHEHTTKHDHIWNGNCSEDASIQVE